MVSDLFQNTKPSKQVLALLLALVFFLFVSSLLQALCIGGGVDVNNIVAQRNFQIISQLLTFLCPTLLFSVFFEGRPAHFLKMGITPGLSFRSIVLGMLCYFLLIPAVGGLTQWNSQWHLPQAAAGVEETLRAIAGESNRIVEAYLSLPGWGNFLANLFILALLPAFCEECFFRGALQQGLLRWCQNKHVAVWLAASFFSAMHGDFFAFVPRLVMGGALGYLFYYSGSIWVNIVAHFANNAVVVIAYLLYSNGKIMANPAEPVCYPFVVMALGFLAAGVIFYFFFCRKKVK